MNDIIELKDDLLVEEGHYLERIQSEALEEGWAIQTCSDFDSIIKEYGIGFVIPYLSKETRSKLHGLSLS